MAQVAQVYSPSYTPDQLRFDKFQKAFADKPHYVWAVYDHVMDQLIMRLVAPSVHASEYYLTDNLALLVRDYDRQVVGLTVVGFQSEFLPKAPKLNELWIENKMAEKLRTYSKEKYKPEPRKEPQLTEQRIFKYSAYQSKAFAEAELVAA